MSALPIAGLWNTGVDGSGTPNAVGTVESHYVVTTDAFSANSPYSFTVVNPATPNWVSNPGDARWIGPSMSPTEGAFADDPVGNYFYTLTFWLDPFSTIQLAGKWTSDNYGWLSLNGVGIASLGLAEFGTLHDFLINDASLFHVGANTLTFQVQNANTGARNPSGLLVSSLRGDYTANVPDGGMTVAMLGFGLIGLVAVRRRISKA